MPRHRNLDSPEPDPGGPEEVTREITGDDAPTSEADEGSAGSGASPFGADQTGLESPAPDYEEQYHLEPDPSLPEDIAPDEIAGPSEPTEAGKEGPKRRRGAGPAGGPPPGRGLLVSRFMSRKVATLRVGEEAEPRALLRRFRRVRHRPVVDEEGRLVGMLTRMDVLEQAAVAGGGLLRVRELMSTPAECVRDDESVQAAAQAMVRARIHSLPVVSADGRLVGIVTDSDLLSALAGERLAAPRVLAELPIDALMTSDPITIDPDATLGEAAGALLQSGARHLPVVGEDDRLLGVLSERDLRERLGGEARQWPHAAREALEERVGNVMTPDPISLRSGTPVSRALEIFTDERVGALPVVDEDDRVQGIVSYIDVLVWLRDRMGRGRRAAPEREGEPAPH